MLLKLKRFFIVIRSIFSFNLHIWIFIELEVADQIERFWLCISSFTEMKGNAERTFDHFIFMTIQMKGDRWKYRCIHGNSFSIRISRRECVVCRLKLISQNYSSWCNNSFIYSYKALYCFLSVSFNYSLFILATIQNIENSKKNWLYQFDRFTLFSKYCRQTWDGAAIYVKIELTIIKISANKLINIWIWIRMSINFELNETNLTGLRSLNVILGELLNFCLILTCPEIKNFCSSYCSFVRFSHHSPSLLTDVISSPVSTRIVAGDTKKLSNIPMAKNLMCLRFHKNQLLL